MRYRVALKGRVRFASHSRLQQILTGARADLLSLGAKDPEVTWDASLSDVAIEVSMVSPNTTEAFMSGRGLIIDILRRNGLRIRESSGNHYLVPSPRFQKRPEIVPEWTILCLSANPEHGWRSSNQTDGSKATELPSRRSPSIQ